MAAVAVLNIILSLLRENGSATPELVGESYSFKNAEAQFPLWSI
jgi:hypothetical protein